MKKIVLILIICLVFLLTQWNKNIFASSSIVSVEKDKNGNWQLKVDAQPYFIKGVLFAPIKIGEDPRHATIRDWMVYDDDNDGKNDIAYQAWIDANRNNKKDADEKIIGDFQLLKEMGANTIRLYHAPSTHSSLGDIYTKNPSTEKQYNHSPNKELLRELHKQYGIKVIMGNFIGAWTIGSGANWDEGTDYNNPLHRENIKKSVKAMVLEHSHEPYVLFWALGNGNNVDPWSQCNARENREVYAKFVNELAQMIKQIDPRHPVAIIDGEDGHNTLKHYAKHGKDIDIIGYNIYKDEVNFQIFLKEVRDIWDKPIYIAEIGKDAYGRKGEDEEAQFQSIRGSWRTILRSSAEFANSSLAIKGTGNVIGVTFFDWLDKWHKDGISTEHNNGKHKWPGTNIFIHKEWFGLMSMGDGSDSLMRQPRKSYDYLKDVWNSQYLKF